MKLYTEEQVKEIYFKGVHNGRLHIEGKCGDEIGLLTPIELPSDEEIEKFINTLPFTKGLDDGQYNDGVIYGAIIGIDWMRNKIQGGNK
jgi:hypothetical protein